MADESIEIGPGIARRVREPAAASGWSYRPRIDVIEDKARPGCYKAVAYLRPHFQLDELGVSLRLVADLPPPAQ